MLEEPSDNALYTDVFGKTRYAGTQAANAAHHKIDLHARLTCPVKRVDDACIHERVQLRPDGGGTAGACMRDFALDSFDQTLEHRKRRNGDLLELRRLGIAGDIVEEFGGVAAQSRI